MGRDVAISLGKAGAKVLAIGRNVERLQLTKAECAENIFTVLVDLCNTEAMENAIQLKVPLIVDMCEADNWYEAK